MPKCLIATAMCPDLRDPDEKRGRRSTVFRRSIPGAVWIVLALLLFAGSADARTRTFCSYSPFYSGKAVNCGRHLQPACSSSPACDAGFNGYSGSPFPITISCPVIDLGITSIDIPDVRVSSGCYDQRPTCASCGGEGEPPCPPQVAGVCDVGCDAGLEVNTSTLTCEEPAPVGIPCVPGLGNCPSGLVCSLAGQCSHKPALEGETCDITAPCGQGLTCTAGIPQRCSAPGEVGDSCHLTLPCRDGLFCQAFTQTCQVYRLPGEGCSAVNPCIEGASCEACFTSRCHSPLQCFWNGNNGAITEQQCRKLYSAGSAEAAQDLGNTLTYAAGDGIAAAVSESQSFGVAYGQGGEYGCFTTFCYGLNLDVSIEAFVAVGLSTDFDSVGGNSFVTTEEAQIPGSLLNFSTSQSFERFGNGVSDLSVGALNGTEDAFSVGIGPNLAPVSAGALLCATTLDVVREVGGDPVYSDDVPPPLETNALWNPNLDVDLAGWTCENQAVCTWVPDDPDASTLSGSAQVASPPIGSIASGGWITSSCAPVEGDGFYELSAYLRSQGARDGALLAIWSSSATCTGGVLRIDLLGSTPPDGTWRRIGEVLRAPAGAQAVAIFASADRDATTDAPSSTQIDQAYVPEPSVSLALGVAASFLFALARRRRGPASVPS